MNRHTLALPLYTLLLAAGTTGAFAETPTAADQANAPVTSTVETTTKPADAASMPTPASPSHPTANQNQTATTQDPSAMQGSGPEEWSMVIGHDKGYVGKSEALPNSWLAQNFTTCDADKDGKVSEAEYQKCQKRR